MLHSQQFFAHLIDKNQVSRVTLVKVGCGLSWVYERAAGKFFFFSACHFRGIRDDIEEEDEQVSELSKVFYLLHRS